MDKEICPDCNRLLKNNEWVRINWGRRICSDCYKKIKKIFKFFYIIVLIVMIGFFIWLIYLII